MKKNLKAIVLGGALTGAVAMASGWTLAPNHAAAGSAANAASTESPPAAAALTGAPATRNLAGAVGADPNVYVDLAKRVVPSVVNISSMSRPKPMRGRGRGMPYGSPEDFFQEFFGGMPGGPRFGTPPQQPNSPGRAALGTGFVLTPGIILTNHHVIAGADEVKVSFTEDPAETPTPAEVIGRDPDLDIALLKVKGDRAKNALPLGDSDALQVGEYVAAVGNPFGQGHSVTHGIISAKGRANPEFPLASWIQTDAPINPGNSGGPLLNLKGEVIGVNVAIDARAQGIGFAIPINAVKAVLPQLQTQGSVSRGYLGVLVGELNPRLAQELGIKKDLKAPIVTQVEPDAPAYKAGIRAWDVILEINDKAIHTPSDLTSAVAGTPAGNTIELKILHEGKERSIKVKTGKRPMRGPHAAPGEEPDEAGDE